MSEIEMNAVELALEKERISLAERRLTYSKNKEKLDPLIEALAAIGCEFSFPNSLDVRLVGDKGKFLQLLRTLRRFGIKVDAIEKGATGFNQFVYLGEAQLWVSFSSTVCRRVKVGTKTVEQDVYETVCDEIYPHGEEEVA